MYFSIQIFCIVSIEYFISKRLHKNEIKGKKVSKAIVRISIISIALAIIVNLITISVVTGFQNQVRNKVTGFSAHYMLMSATDENVVDAKPISKNQALVDKIHANSKIKSIYPVAYKPLLLQSERNERTIKGANQVDSIITEQNVYGVLLKGVDQNFDWNFFKESLVSGKLPKVGEQSDIPEILISQKIATDLKYNVGDTIRSFFVKSKPLLKKLKVTGIYETGLEEHDTKFILGDIKLVQAYSDWGLVTETIVEDTTLRVKGFEEEFIIRVRPQGGSGTYLFDWGRGEEFYAAKSFNPYRDTTITVIVKDAHFKNNPLLRDTCRIHFKIEGVKKSATLIQQKDNTIVKTFIQDDPNHFWVNVGANKKAEITIDQGIGTAHNYIGAYEVNLKDWNELANVQKELVEMVEFNPALGDEQLKVSSIIDQENDIFTWLSFLDINVLIIITLMLLIGIINMGSALLVLIIIKTNFIGVLKAIGATNWMIRKVFLYQAGFLILRGMIIGNVIGLGICLAQQHFSIIPLNPEVYYLNTVPIEVSIWNWIALNVVTFIICIVALIIPSIVITRIMPSKSIKFN